MTRAVRWWVRLVVHTLENIRRIVRSARRAAPPTLPPPVPERALHEDPSDWTDASADVDDDSITTRHRRLTFFGVGLVHVADRPLPANSAVFCSTAAPTLDERDLATRRRRSA